jgi:hypothetical protein
LDINIPIGLTQEKAGIHPFELGQRIACQSQPPILPFGIKAVILLIIFVLKMVKPIPVVEAMSFVDIGYPKIETGEKLIRGVGAVAYKKEILMVPQHIG